jgi:hypothetical protein
MPRNEKLGKTVNKASGKITSESNKIKIIVGRLFPKLMSAECSCISSFLTSDIAYSLAGKICFIAEEIQWAGTICSALLSSCARSSVRSIHMGRTYAVYEVLVSPNNKIAAFWNVGTCDEHRSDGGSKHV